MQLSERVDEATLVADGLRWIVHGLRATGYAIERDLGVSGAQLFVLRELAAEPGASIRRLSQRTLTDPSSVSVVVARLVERGLVDQKRDPKDARRSVLALSLRGKALLKKAPEPYQARLIAALRTLSPRSLQQFRKALGQVLAALGVEAGAPPMFFDDTTPTQRKPRRVTRPRS
jgi:DNA-binding MarR family transcriptional regulator